MRNRGNFNLGNPMVSDFAIFALRELPEREIGDELDAWQNLANVPRMRYADDWDGEKNWSSTSARWGDGHVFSTISTAWRRGAD